MKTKKRIAQSIIGLILFLFIYSCSKSDVTPPSSGGNTKVINISGMAFPASVTVAKGTSVTWNNSDAMPHTVTSDDGTSFNSGNLAGNASFKYVANTAGTFEYHCDIHPGMKGVLVVTP